MRIFQLVVMITLCFLASAAQAAGFRFIDVPADPQGPAFRAPVWSPCERPPGLVDLGRAMLPGVRDCPLPPATKQLPLVVMSHRRGGSLIRTPHTATAP